MSNSAWIIDIDGTFHEMKGESAIRIADLIMRLQTIKGEQSFNANNGLDFLNIINGLALVEIEIENIIRDFDTYFDIKVSKSEKDTKKGILSIEIEIKVKNNEDYKEPLKYNILLGNINKDMIKKSK